MCGIVGVAAFGAQQYPTVEQLKRMCDSLIHRGPDEEGLEVKDGVGIGIRRLSIIDLVRGSQPICNEDRSVRTVFNGEIYNFRELRRDLEGRGHQFRTQTDTEVIVHGYEEYGTRLPLYLNGMFAFAVHDSRKRKLLLVRDHVGIKPLFYAGIGTLFTWLQRQRDFSLPECLGAGTTSPSIKTYFSVSVRSDRCSRTFEVVKLTADHDVNLAIFSSRGSALLERQGPE